MIFFQGDYASLSQKIDERLDNPRKREYDLSEYDWKQIAERVSDIYDEVARLSGPPRKADKEGKKL